MRAALTILWALAALGAGPAAGPAGQDDARGRELECRRWALTLDTSPELAEVFEGAFTWRRRASALDAIARSLSAGIFPRDPSRAELLLRVRAAVSDEHPNVRAAALGVLALLPEAFTPFTDAAARVRGEPLPVVRRAWARYLATQPGAAPILARLAQDPDDDVAREALAGLVAAPDRDEDLLVTACERLVAEGDTDGLLELAYLVERHGASKQLLIRLSTVCEKGFGGDAVRQGAWAAVFHALSLRLHRFLAPHGLAFPHVIVGGWLGAPGDGPRRRALILRAARLGGPGLAEPLAFAALGAEPGQRGEYVDGMVEALDAQHLVDGILGLRDADAGLRALLWERLRGRAARFDFEATRPWLAPGTPSAVRENAVATIAQAFADTGDAGSAELLVLALDDPELEIAFDAYSTLAHAADPTPWLADLQRVWSARPDGERWGPWLQALPRGPRLAPFRDELLAGGRARRELRAGVSELLAPFTGDAELAGAIEGWLAEELEALGAVAAEDGRTVELTAVACLRALAAIRGAEAVPSLAAALERCTLAWRAADAGAPLRDACIGIGKIAAMLLGKHGAPRELLAPLLAEDAPRRLRIEAALALVRAENEGDAAAVQALMSDYRGCDAELRTRVLRAFAGLDDARSLDFLSWFVGITNTKVEAAAVEVQEAVDALKARAARARVPEQAARAVMALQGQAVLGRDPERRRAGLEALGALARSGGDELRSWLHERRRELDTVLEDASREDVRREAALVQREAALVAEARSGDRTEAIGAALWKLPRLAATETLGDRFLARKLASVEFTWRAELEVAAILARQGRLSTSLHDLWELDARLLLEMGRRAAAAGTPDGHAAATELLRAGLVALAGEGEREDTEELAFRARLDLLALAERVEDWDTYAWHAALLLAEWRAGRLSERVFRRAFGDFDPRRGEDGGARLEAAVLQARAWAALAAGASEAPEEASEVMGRARELADQARAAVGFSRAALDAQARLERRLSE